MSTWKTFQLLNHEGGMTRREVRNNKTFEEGQNLKRITDRINEGNKQVNR